MSGTQSRHTFRCDAYDGLIAALDPGRERSREIGKCVVSLRFSCSDLQHGSPAERLAGDPHAMHDDRELAHNGDFGFTDWFICVTCALARAENEGHWR